jgi:transcriptional regulator with XRE-family HTH domain
MFSEHSVLMIDLAIKLRALTENLGITSVEAAKRCGLDKRRFGHYMTGRSRPNYETLVTICKALGSSPNILLDFPGENESVEIQQLVNASSNLEKSEIRVLIATAASLSKRSNKSGAST